MEQLRPEAGKLYELLKAEDLQIQKISMPRPEMKTKRRSFYEGTEIPDIHGLGYRGNRPIGGLIRKCIFPAHDAQKESDPVKKRDHRTWSSYGQSWRR